MADDPTKLAQPAAATPAAPAPSEVDPDPSEDLTPYPTQAQADALKLGKSLEGDKAGTYKNRAAKAG